MFSELHVISDLHLGGTPGRQIFSGAAELCAFVDSLSHIEAPRSVGLVINGDFIDFLAEEPALHFDLLGAPGKLNRIRSDPSFAEIWVSLRRFVAAANRCLILVIGNHDIELAAPRVTHHLLESICDGNDAARGRIILSNQGYGFAARVGGRRVLCVHGNEADTWNVVDYDRLRRIGVELQVEGKAEPWIPNAGTMLVIDVMNELKWRYPFIDLLKPEVEGVIPLLWALDQGTAARLARCLKVGKRLAWDKIRRAIGLLSGYDEYVAPEDDPRLLFELLHGPVQSADSTRSAADQLLEDATLDLRRGIDPASLVTGTGELGFAGALWLRISGESPLRVAFQAMERLVRDQSFSRSVADKTFERLDNLIGQDADFVIAGHTHLEKDLARRRAHGRYFNTGTWARLIKLRPEWVVDQERFAPVWMALQKRTLKELDQARHEDHPLVSTRRTVASVWEDQGQIHAALRRIRLDGGTLQVSEPRISEE